MDGFEEHIFINSKNQKFQIRQARLSDLADIVTLLTLVWFDGPFTNFQNPYRHQYPGDLIRYFYLAYRELLLNPWQVSLVAVPLNGENRVVAYVRFKREGDDAAARQFFSARWSLWNFLLWWYSRIDASVRNFFWPDRTVDKEAQKKGREARQKAAFELWGQPAMQKLYGNRWHLTTLLTATDWQRQGLGRHLTQIVLNQAEKERVVVGLEATAEGEKLYTQMGFQLRARSEVAVGGYRETYMMWTPRKEA